MIPQVERARMLGIPERSVEAAATQTGRDSAMMSQVLVDAINKQIHEELGAFYSYLAMSAWCQQPHLTGSPRWLRAQSQEEYGHAMRLFDFVLARNARLDLRGLDQPRGEYKSLTEVFETAYEQEKTVSGQIDALYEL